MNNNADQKKETTSPKIPMYSNRFITIFGIVIAVIVATELMWSSHKIPELRESSPKWSEKEFHQLNGIQITALAICSGLLITLFFYLGNRAAQIKNRPIRVFLAITCFVVMMVARMAIEPLFYGYSSPKFILAFAGLTIWMSALNTFTNGDASANHSPKQPEQKPVGWSQPPENDWWSKYN